MKIKKEGNSTIRKMTAKDKRIIRKKLGSLTWWAPAGTTTFLLFLIPVIAFMADLLSLNTVFAFLFWVMFAFVGGALSFYLLWPVAFRKDYFERKKEILDIPLSDKIITNMPRAIYRFELGGRFHRVSKKMFNEYQIGQKLRVHYSKNARVLLKIETPEGD